MDFPECEITCEEIEVKPPDCDHEAYEVQADGSCVCTDCREEVGGIGSAPDEYWSEVE